jgi:hypothetical protein
MNWKDVTVWQWQQIQNIALKQSEGDTFLDIAVKTLAILKNQTEGQIDSLSLKELKDELTKIEWVNTTQPKPKPQNYIKVGNKRYKCIFDVRNMSYARYIETKFFAEDVTNNLHKIAASMVVPMKLTWRGWKVAKYDSTKHEEYANDLLSAPFESVYGSLVFFCQVLRDSIRIIVDSSRNELIQKGLSELEIEVITKDLWSDLDGFINQLSSQTTYELS